MRVAALDLGSNSFLCLIAELDERGFLKEVYDDIEIVRLGKNLSKTKTFAKDSLERADKALAKFKHKIDHYGVKKILTAATSATRDATNKNELFEIASRYGVSVGVISGEEEAELTYLGVQSAWKEEKDVAVIDIGGGSTEIVYKEGAQIRAVSFDVGCVRLTEKFLLSCPEKKTEIESFLNFLKSNTDTHKIPIGQRELVAVAGTPTTLASIDLKTNFDPVVIEGHRLTLQSIKEIISTIEPLELEKRKKIKGIDPLRADVIMSGALILKYFLESYSKTYCRVSTRGVRYGLAYKYLKSLN